MMVLPEEFDRITGGYEDQERREKRCIEKGRGGREKERLGLYVKGRRG
jgi:hypothetical protein